MLRIGIAGLGFMGKAHLDIYQKMPGKARVTAIAEQDARKREGTLSVVGNIGDVAAPPDLEGVTFYESLDRLLAEADVDLVDVTLPTFMHRDAVLKCFAAGKHVVCEKPLALEYGEAMEMADAARSAGRRLFVGMCVRFFPAYRKAYDLVKGGEYGEVRTAAFSRLSARPAWMWRNWALDEAKSGGAPLDLHIHDADFVSHLFGKPRAVTASAGGRSGVSGPLDHICASYHFGDERLVTATGAWEYPAGYPFSMTFSIHMNDAAVALAADGALTLYRDGVDPEALPVPEGDGWFHELRHFVDCVLENRDSEILAPEDAAFSVKLVRAEIESARRGTRVELS